jgi:hypothetical protein
MGVGARLVRRLVEHRHAPAHTATKRQAGNSNPQTSDGDRDMSLIDRIAAAATQTNARTITPPVTPGAPIQRVADDTRTSLPSGFLRRILDMRDSVPEPTRLGRPGYIHASALVSLCPRQHSLMVESGITTEERITGAHRVMWKIGRAVEAHVRNQLIDGFPTGSYGNWSCNCPTQTTHHGFRPSPDHTLCPVCRGRLHTYNEVTLFDEENHVSGNPDLITRYEERYIPIEIKSMVKHQWDDLRRPLPNHIIQAAAYRKLLRTNGFPVHPDVALIYVAKDFSWGSPYKEFHVNVATQQMEGVMTDLFTLARTVLEHQRANTLPPRVMCSHQGGAIARQCPVAGPCFARSS